MAKVELIFVPTPMTSHFVSTIEFAKRLIDLDDRIQVTILLVKFPLVPYADAYVRSLAASRSTIQVVEVPDLENPPSTELFSTSGEAYMLAFAKKSLPTLRETISGIQSSRSLESVRVIGLVHDFFFDPLVDVANELNIPSFIYLTSGAGFLALLKFLGKCYDENSSADGPYEKDWDEKLLIPGFANPVPSRVLPPSVFNKVGYDAYVELGRRTKDAKGIMVNTFTELEPYAMSHLTDESPDYPPVYPVGPLLGLNIHPHPNLDPVVHDKVLRWLDHQPESSVVYVCFGSLERYVPVQVREIAVGLELSGHRFLWRVQEELLPEGFVGRTAGLGMVCGWAPQVQVLAHKAVGGFVSHCGWNSLLEGVWHGVPILAWPMAGEQQLNAFTLLKEVGAAREMKMDYKRGRDLLKAEEIARRIKSLMESDGGMREKAKEMAEKARKALTDGGSSSVAINRFLHGLMGNNPF